MAEPLEIEKETKYKIKNKFSPLIPFQIYRGNLMNKIHIFKSQLLQLCLFIYFVISAKHTYIYTNKSIKQLLIGSYFIQHKHYSHFTFDFCNIVHKTKSNTVTKSKFLFLF